MKRTSKVLASGAFFAVANIIANAQTPPTGSFQQDAQNRAVVDAFIRQNPDLPGIVALAYGVPFGEDITPTADGNYVWHIPDATGAVQSFVTFGQSIVLANLADSIQAAADPAQQLGLYQSMYPQYVALYNQLCGTPAASVGGAGCANLTPPSSLTPPSALQNASLGVIKGALSALTSQGITIINKGTVPTGLGPFAVCSAETGATMLASNATFHKGDPPGLLVFGDQTDSSCTNPSPSGIVKNLTWQNENLLTCVKEQATRGTCQKFAAISALEELIARDTGDLVNLSEQDFDENQNESWPKSWTPDHGNPKIDLENAKEHSYQFAYENQWDYNPAYGSKTNPAYPCEYYPSAIEPECSESSPPPTLSGPRSPYMSDGATRIWDSHPELMVDKIIFSLAFNNAVIMTFKETANWKAATALGGYVVLDSTDLLVSKGGHAVHIVGYIDNATLAGNPATKWWATAQGEDYFIIKNSWGKCNGDLGYYYMPVDYLTARATGVYVVSSVSH